MPRAVPIRTDIPSAERHRRAEIEPDGRASRRMLARMAIWGVGTRESEPRIVSPDARQAGMDRQNLRARRSLLAAFPLEMGQRSPDLCRVHRFNAEGIEGLRDRPHTGRPSRLTEAQMAIFRAVVLRGPDSERDGPSPWTAKDLCRIVEQRQKVGYSETGMLKILKCLDLSWQKTQLVHPEADPRAQADFKKNAAA